MNKFRIALANIRYPANPEESVVLAERAITQASVERAELICFPECHPYFHETEPGGYVPSSFADPANSFFEKAMLCRAAENTCYFASVNIASHASPTTSAIVRPDGKLLCYQPYGKEGLLIADIDITEATGLFAARCKYA